MDVLGVVIMDSRTRHLALFIACCALSMGWLSPTASAHPGSLWGIDVSSVVGLSDQARVIAHQNKDDDRPAADPLSSVQTIVIDPGHGGDNSGATGIAGVPEKELTLDLAYELRDALQQRYPDLRVILTRYWDASVSLQDRVHLANLAQADLFLSLHYNAAPHGRAVGFETYFLEPADVTPGEEQPQGLPVASLDDSIAGLEAPIEGAESIGYEGATLELIRRDLLQALQHDLSGSLAETVQHRFVEHIDSVDRGVKQAPFAVLRGAHMPAVVIEAGFLTHPEEGWEVLTQEHQQDVINAIKHSIIDFDQLLDTVLDAPPEDFTDQPISLLSRTTP